MADFKSTILTAGFILQIYSVDGNKPINRVPWYIFQTQELCEADRKAFLDLAEEWYTICVPESSTPIPLTPKRGGHGR